MTRGSGHNKFGGYTETPAEYQEVIDRLAGNTRPQRISFRCQDSESSGRAFGIIALGGCDPAVREAVDLLAERRHSQPIIMRDPRLSVSQKRRRIPL